MTVNLTVNLIGNVIYIVDSVVVGIRVVVNMDMGVEEKIVAVEEQHCVEVVAKGTAKVRLTTREDI